MYPVNSSVITAVSRYDVCPNDRQKRRHCSAAGHESYALALRARQASGRYCANSDDDRAALSWEHLKRGRCSVSSISTILPLPPKRAEIAVAHSLTETMLHKPCGFVGDLERAMQLVGADAFLAARHQMRGLKPLVQLHMAALEDRSDRDGEFALAWPAAAQSGAAALDRRNPIKAAAARTERPLRPYNCFKPSDRCGFVVEMGLRKQWTWPTPNLLDSQYRVWPSYLSSI